MSVLVVESKVNDARIGLIREMKELRIVHRSDENDKMTFYRCKKFYSPPNLRSGDVNYRNVYPNLLGTKKWHP